jgi:hypothetical protein
MSKRDYVVEIEQIRNRTGPSEWDNGITKLFWLSEKVKLIGDAEENVYFIVASIAAVESYFRWEIRQLIDSGNDSYVNNFRLNESFKLNKEHLVAVHRRRVTVGELAAHSVRLNNPGAICDIMSQLLGTDFVALIKGARYQKAARTDKAEVAQLVIASFPDMKKMLDRTFELRHMVCHEAHLDSETTTDEIKELCATCYNFVLASRYSISLFDDPNPPRTLSEENALVEKELKALEVVLQGEEQRIVSDLHDPLAKKAFGRMQHSWRQYAQHQGEYDASLHMNGTRGAIQHTRTLIHLYKKRLDDLEDIGKIKGRRYKHAW